MVILQRLQFQCDLCKLFDFVFYNIIIIEFRIILSPPITGIVNNDELKTRNNYLQMKLLSIEILSRSIAVTFQ